MLTSTLTMGDIEVSALLDGVRVLRTSLADSFPDVPADALEASAARFPELVGEGGRWRMHARAWLIRHPRGVVLVDTGVGRAGAPGPEWFGAPGQLLDALAETGTGTDSIDTVLLSHVHDDHIGGTVVFTGGVAEPAFPNANHLLQRADREWQAELARDEEEDRVIESLLLRPLERAGLLTLLDGDLSIGDGISIGLAPGHTPGHQIVRLSSGGARMIIGADAFNHPTQLPHPEWRSATDATPEQAEATRRSLLAEAQGDPRTTLALTHFPRPFGSVEIGEDGLATWVPG
jgi:glyoxylase-like metal-dependent hydrolase (beta-lactamase superfamily II)